MHTEVHVFYLDIEFLELELPQMAITLQVPSPSGTEEFEVDLEEEILEQFRQKISGSLCYTYSWP